MVISAKADSAFASSTSRPPPGSSTTSTISSLPPGDRHAYFARPGTAANLPQALLRHTIQAQGHTLPGRYSERPRREFQRNPGLPGEQQNIRSGVPRPARNRPAPRGGVAPTFRGFPSPVRQSPSQSEVTVCVVPPNLAHRSPSSAAICMPMAASLWPKTSCSSRARCLLFASCTETSLAVSAFSSEAVFVASSAWSSGWMAEKDHACLYAPAMQLAGIEHHTAPVGPRNRVLHCEIVDPAGLRQQFFQQQPHSWTIPTAVAYFEDDRLTVSCGVVAKTS